MMRFHQILVGEIFDERESKPDLNYQTAGKVCHSKLLSPQIYTFNVFLLQLH